MRRPDPGRFATALRRFEELSDLPPGARAAALAELAASDPELGRVVVDLFAADHSAGEKFLDGGVGEFAPEIVGEALDGRVPSSAAPGERVGPYRLRALLGRGGMGEVWEAERADGQFDQIVALKLLKRGMDSEEVLRRFLRERQILARLEHPHIARLLDGGIAADGRPFFALERVEGEALGEWCRAHGASLRTRLELLIAVADAVAVAHRSLIVHRDLKPSNILVDGEGRVKLLDFGIAKLLSDDAGDPGDRTHFEARALTPAYAAPEQIRGEPVTTATDVYALGVVLYELLAGRLPHDRSGSSAVALTDQLERETMTRPSQAAAEAGETRRARLLMGDLDTIVLKALAREPGRRYESATALADDLRRHLDGRPVRARPDSSLYRTRKFVARHKVGVVSAALAMLSLAAGLSAALWQARRAAANAVRAEANAQRAESNAARAERVKEFLVASFEIASPDYGIGGTTTASQLIEQAGRQIDAAGFGRDPEIRADLLEAVARIEKTLGQLDAAARYASAALELRRGLFPAGHPAIASATATLGSVRLAEGRLDEAEKALTSAVRTLEVSEPPGSLMLARVRSEYSEMLFWRGRAVQSEVGQRKVWEAYRAALGDDALPTATHLRNLAVLLEDLGRLDEAEAANRSALAVFEKRLGTDHPSTAASYVNLGHVLDTQGHHEEAEGLLRRGLEIRRAKLGDNHPVTGQSIQLYALFLLDRGRLDESEALYREHLAIFSAINPRHFEVGKCKNGLALIASRRGDHATAEREMRSVLELFREQLGEEHHFVWQVTANLARQIFLQKRFEEAEVLQRQVLAGFEKVAGAESAAVAEALTNLAKTLKARGDDAGAAPLEARAQAITSAAAAKS